MTMLAKVIVTVLVTAISGHGIWIHAMHGVYDEYPEEGQSTPADSHQGRFLSLSRDQLIRIKRMLRRLPYRNALLDAIRNAATEAERGLDVDVSFDDIVPDPEDRLLEMWQFDNDFQTTGVEYMSTEHTQSKIQLLSNTNDVPDPEERNQTQGQLGCFADFHAYIGPLTRRWLWDVLTLNNISTGSLDRPDAPERKYSFILDAIGRRPTGLYEGQFHWLGSYEECTTQVIHHTVRVRPGLLDPPENRTFRGKYARLDMPISLDVFGLNDTLPYSLGTCVPDTCTKEDIFWYIMHNNSILSAVMWGIEDVYLGQETDWTTDKPAKAAFGILLAVATIIIFATCYDGWGRHRIIRQNIKKRGSGNLSNSELTTDDLKMAKHYLYEKPSILDKLEVAFSSYSLYTNLRNIFTTRPRYEGYHIPALDGIRALSVMWIVYGMTYVYGIVYMECWTTANLLSAIKHYSEMWSFMSVVQVLQANATLFFISGFLCIHMWYRHWNRNYKRVSFLMVIKWIFARYVRYQDRVILNAKRRLSLYTK